MDSSSLVDWAYCCQGKSMEELQHSLLYAILELESTKRAVQDDLRKRDDHLIHLKQLLDQTTRERDEAESKCQRLLFERLSLQQLMLPLSRVSSIDDDPRKGFDSQIAFSSSDCDESIVSSPSTDPMLQNPPQVPPAPTSTVPPELDVVPQKPLPEKGKLLQAVMQAGPLLHTLLLAGPLPQWKHPPPPVASSEIPPVETPSPSLPPPRPPLQDSNIGVRNCITSTICAAVSTKRLVSEGSTSPRETKYQRVVLR